MALAARSAVALTSVRRVPSWLGSAAALSLCASGLVLLVPPALASGSVEPASAPVSVRLEGELSTAGLPEAPAVSRLSVRNDGASAISWSAHSSVIGHGASSIRVETWASADHRCTAPLHLLTMTDWSEAPIPPGGSTGLCVRITATGTAVGLVDPSVTVTARPAGT